MVYTAAIGKFRSSLCKYRFFGFLGGSLDSRTSLLPSLPSAIGKTVRHVNEVNRRDFRIWGPFLESPGNFSGSFNNFENDEMKLSVNEAKLTGL